LLFSQADYFAETKGLADPAVRFYTKFYLERFTLDETLDYARSVFDLSLDTSATVAAWLHEKTLGHPFFLAFVCKYLTTTAGQIQPDKLEPIWPAIFDQLGREKFRSDVSQLSAREFEFVRRFANLSENELATQHYTGKFRENTSHDLLRRACSSAREEDDTSSTTRSFASSYSKTNEAAHTKTRAISARTQRQACRCVRAVPFPLLTTGRNPFP